MNASAPPLDVACAADAAYALPLAVMLRSFADRLRPGLRAHIHVIDDGIGSADRDRIAASVPGSCVLHWIPAGRAGSGTLPTWGRMPLTTYQKLVLAERLPAALGRVLWLDCDLLVRADPERLWRTPLGDHLALAVQDSLVPLVSSRFGVGGWRELGLAAASHYFNAGVLLIDLAGWRREGVAARATEYLERFADRVYFWDQEALNAALAGRWGELDARWNRSPTLARILRRRATADEETWIAHYSGRLKPWRNPAACDFASEYLAALDRTPWVGWRPVVSWRSRLLARYADSALRRRLFPLEQIWTAAHRFATRSRRIPGAGRSTTAPAAH